MDLSNEMIEATYESLTPIEKGTIDRLVEQLEKEIKARRERNVNLGRKGVFELLAKLGIWLNKQEKGE